MTKLSEEIRQADDQNRDRILNLVSHIDLKKEFVFLVEEQGKVANVVETIKTEPQPLIDNVEPLEEKKPKKKRGRPSKKTDH